MRSMFFFWYRPVLVIGIPHLSVSDMLGSAESSPWFYKF